MWTESHDDSVDDLETKSLWKDFKYKKFCKKKRWIENIFQTKIKVLIKIFLPWFG